MPFSGIQGIGENFNGIQGIDSILRYSLGGSVPLLPFLFCTHASGQPIHTHFTVHGESLNTHPAVGWG